MSMKSGETEKEGRSSGGSVHSANQWESADFGDSGQKEKFLRLMGGMKKQHTGRFVIGETNKDAHSRTIMEAQKIEENLEHQYEVGLEKKMTGQNRRHVGLGFAEPEEKEKADPGAHIRFDEDDDASKDSEILLQEPGDGKRGPDREEARRDKRQKRDETGIAEPGASRGEGRGGSHPSGQGEDRKHRDHRDDRRETSTSELGDSGRNGGKKHRHSEAGDEATEQKSKKHKDSDSD